MSRKATNLVNSLSQISIRRGSRIIAHGGADRVDENTLNNFMGNAYSLGYLFNEDAQAALLKYSRNELDGLLSQLQLIKGANVEYNPMYPNFPKQVIEASEFELIINAFAHYLGDAIGVRVLPAYDKEKREPLSEDVTYTVLGAAKSADLKKIATDLLKQKSPWSEQDIEDLKELVDYVTPVELEVKENIATAFSIFPDLDWRPSVKTLTDVLRVAVSLSAGDVSLADNTKFSLSRPQRRVVVQLLEEVLKKNKNNTEDFARYPEVWKRLIKALHVSDYVSSDSPVIDAVKVVYNKSAKSFNSFVEEAIANNDHEKLLKLLSKRPGDFARRLNHMVRLFPDHRDQFVSSFSDVSHEVSLTVLVQMWNFFNGPDSNDLPQRAVHYKSRNIRSGLIKNTLSGDYSDVISAIQKGMKNRNDKKVFLKAPSNMKLVVPLGVRSASTGSRQIGRGSRVKIGDKKKIVRLFMHWKNTNPDNSHYNNRVDLDLSAVLISEEFKKSSSVWYGNLRSGSIAFHSGDITSAPHGASEFIDVDIQKAIDSGYRYVAMNVHSYSRQKFSEIPEAWAGVMLREKLNSGEIYEARTVENRFDLNTESVQSLPAVFDLVNREMIWVDSSQLLSDYGNYNVLNQSDSSLLHVKSAVSDRRMTVEELVDLTATRVESEDAADLVIDALSTEQVLGLL